MKRFGTSPTRRSSGGCLLRLLHEMEAKLRLASVEELIRLIGSPHFGALTAAQIRSVADYDAIEIEGERYFERAFSPGKEASSSLALACMLGPGPVLEDLFRLHAGLTGVRLARSA